MSRHRATEWLVYLGYTGLPLKFSTEAEARDFYDRHKSIPSYINPKVNTPIKLLKVTTTWTTLEKNRV